MNDLKKWKLFVKQHNTGLKFTYGEVKPFFDDGFTSFENGTYLAACLCFITGVEMTLRLPFLFENGLDISHAYKSNQVPLLNHGLLRRAKAAGMPVEMLAYPDETNFLSKIGSQKVEDRVRIVRLRNNICHGNLDIFVKGKAGNPDVKIVDNEDIKQEAIHMDRIVLLWADGFEDWLNS